MRQFKIKIRPPGGSKTHKLYSGYSDRWEKAVRNLSEAGIGGSGTEKGRITRDSGGGAGGGWKGSKDLALVTQQLGE